jgi:cytochrome P450
LREELHTFDILQLGDEPQSCTFPMLDSFIKESMRVNASDAESARRKALTPLTLSDGTHVQPGDWICVPQQAMFLDEAYYTNATVFDARRFLKAGEEWGLTDPSHSWAVWGCGRPVWYLLVSISSL